MHDDGLLDRVQDLVPLHGFTDVLDVVQATEISTGYSWVGVVEPGGDNQAVPGDVAGAGDARRLAVQVDARDVRVVVDVDAGVHVGLFRCQEEALEIVDL